MAEPALLIGLDMAAGPILPSALELLLVVPLLALLAALPLGRCAARLMPVMALVMPALALWLVTDVVATGAVELGIGNWQPPLGIGYCAPRRWAECRDAPLGRHPGGRRRALLHGPLSGSRSGRRSG